MNYEVIILPALYVASALAILVTLIRGVKREATGVADDGLQTYRWGYSSRNLVIAGIILGVTAIVIPALVVTPPGHRGVIYSMWGGVSNDERPEGLSLVVPYAQTPHQVNVRTQKIEIEAFAQSLDLQEITVKASINYHINPSLAAEVFTQLGPKYAETVIAPAALQRIDAEVGLIAAIDFAAARNTLASNVVAALDDQLGAYGIIIEYVNIEDALFQEPFIAAVQRKVIALEDAETELRNVERAKNQAAQVVAEAVGTATAIERVATAQANANDAINASLTTDVLLWQRLLSWDGVLPTTLLGGDDALGALIEIGAD